MLQILAPLEFLDVLEEVLGLDTTTISDPIFEYSPPPINGVRVDPALFALDVGIFGKLVLLVSTSSRTSRNSSGAKICSIVTRSSLYASMFETDIFRFDEVNHSQILL